MKQQHYFIPTMRSLPADAEVVSHQLMLKAGLIRRLASGVYSYLPLGYKVLRKLEHIVREEMDLAGALEMHMPALHPAELWKQSKRWDVLGEELMRLHDRHGREFALGPTHEEVVTSIVRDEINTYKKLPLTLYQIQTKFRDERRPRFGVMRSREFVMKDAYSFDTDENGLDDSYQKMFAAYTSIFTRCGLDFRAVEADSGAMGGTGTHEFMVLSDIGEDTIAYCDLCSYAANLEKAEVSQPDHTQNEMIDQAAEHTASEDESSQQLEPQTVATPNMRTIAELSHFLNISPQQMIKTIALSVDDQIVLALVRGDYELNEVKVKNLLGADVVDFLDERRIQQDLQSVPGFLGPQQSGDWTVLADYSIQGLKDAVIGANVKDQHVVHAVPGRDFKIDRYVDIRNVTEGDECPKCSGKIQLARGIEVGHVFKLGTKYSEAFHAVYLDQQGKTQPMVMGCYGIGVSRVLAAVVEQYHDEHGLCWPEALAPFDIHLIAVNMKDTDQASLAEQLYTDLRQQGFDVLYDNRSERAGVKFADADLIGIPVQIIVGKKAVERLIEVKYRASGEKENIAVESLPDFLTAQHKYS